MISDAQQFIRAMAARGVLRFSAKAAPATKADRAEQERLRAERQRRSRGCRVYAQPFKGRLPARSDPGYRAAYMRLARAAKKGKQV